MDELFCKDCGNIHKLTTEFTLCGSCEKIDYLWTDVLFPHITSKSVGFVATYASHTDILRSGLGLTSDSEILDYFIMKGEYFPEHIANSRCDGLKLKYLKWLQEIGTDSEVDSSSYSDATAIAMSEVKYLLYGRSGQREQVNPQDAGLYSHQFKQLRTQIHRILTGLQKTGLDHVCDVCGCIGFRSRLLRGGEIHPYDGCIWCS